ncbi:EF-hand calcium-binding domain-containing protein 6-like isoform X3 [Mercenaria mercenaria]|uniref:EF-hand calcium-binding domain-containing protein 6-like isoform X3 n=1 Tax=Mercenaria mercenaria TaxID=6596 RepID=UPI001E1D9E51|nr:EF-hand calcium-binding domain-containing protein 6-like isoform X3 [Mercenaria mercenaria]
MSQVGVRPASQMSTGRMGVTLPQIQHPMSRMSNPGDMELRGVSRSGDRPMSNPGRPLANESHYPVRKSMSALSGRDSRQASRLGRENVPPPMAIDSIPEGVEVTFGDPSKTRMPIFGNKADVTSRPDLPPSRASSRLSTASAQARLEIDELEMLLRQRMRGNFFEIRKQFQNNDPEGKGNVSREALYRILMTVLGRQLTQNQFMKLLERLGFNNKVVINYTEFFSLFRKMNEEDSSFPKWMDPVQRTHLEKACMSSEQVHQQLKEKAKQRVMDVAELIPQMNPGGSGRIMKPELRQLLNRLMFYMDDIEFEKLWNKYDPDASGTISGEKFMRKLGITFTNGAAENGRLSPIAESDLRKLKISDRRVVEEFKTLSSKSSALTRYMQFMQYLEQRSKRTPRRKEVERRNQLDIERWLKNKFREGFSTMRESFEAKDPKNEGSVGFDDFLEVLGNYGLKLEKKYLAAFLSRCSVSANKNGTIPYREFLHRFQDRSEKGMTHTILTDNKHRLVRLFNNDQKSENGSNLSAIEGQLMNMFQRDFLALLGTFKSIDKLETNVISQEEFRAAMESRFNLTLTDEQFDGFVDRIPLDEDGNVKYTDFMQQFDTRGMAPSLFPSKENDTRKIVKVGPLPEDPPKPMEPTTQRSDMGEYITFDEPPLIDDSVPKRSPQEMFRVIKDLLNKKFNEVENMFFQLDEINSMRMSQEQMFQLLRRFPEIRPEVTRGEIRDLWKTFITNKDKTLDYYEFVRHFGFSKTSAAFPNAKRVPPRHGDADFMIRSRKLNCAADMLQDSLRSKIDYMWEDLRKEFVGMDPYGIGYVSQDEFRDVLKELCVHLSEFELDTLTRKFDIKKDGRVSYIEFLKPFALRKQIWRHGNNMLSLLQHPQAELPVSDIVEPPQKGLHGLTAKLRQKLAGDWKNLRRAFRKLDKTNNGYLSVPEFRSVLKLANVILDEDEVYHVLNRFDHNMSGKIQYEKFIEETFKPETRHSVRPV